MMVYIILIKDIRGYGEYYAGRTYQFKKQIYPIEVTREKAKTYKSRKIAERVAENLQNRLAFSCSCIVEERE